MKEKNLWFKARKYGWGWTPITWQGWLVTFLFLCLVYSNFLDVDSLSHSVSDTLMNFAFRLIFLILALILVCYVKGEKPQWRWSGKKIKL